MSSINFSGLSTGIDSAAIIDQLVAVEKSTANIYAGRKEDISSQLSTVGELISKLQTLKEETEELDAEGDTGVYSATSSDEDNITVTAEESAQAGSYSLRVMKLAKPETTGSSTFNTADAGAVGTGSVTIAVGTEPGIQVDYDATSSLHDIASSINDTVDGVHASVLYDGATFRLLVSSEEPGLDNALTFTDAGSSLGLADPGAELIASEDAEIQLNGITVTRSTNHLTDVIDGVNFDLETVTDLAAPDTTITVERDAEGTAEKLESFIESYNAVATLLDGQLSHTGEDRGRNTLFGDSTLRGLRQSLTSLIGAGYANGSGSVSLGFVGIEMDNSGKISLDKDKFDDAISADPGALDSLFAGSGGDGVAAALTTLIVGYTRSGDGVLVGKQEGMRSRMDAYDYTIDKINTRAELVGDRLRRQFTALETLVSTLQSQQNYLNQLMF